jgi:predicted nucleic acid-binding protein
MIILDTNVLSEPLRPAPDPAVVTWLDAQSIATLYVTAISLAEIRYGLAALPSGSRRSTLVTRFESEVAPLFVGRVLAFDEPAAAAYGTLRARMRADGRAIGDLDALIAAIASSRRFSVATRDARPFTDAGLTVIDPFGPPPVAGTARMEPRP